VLYGFRNVDAILRKAGISAKSGLNIVNSITRTFCETRFITIQSSASKLAKWSLLSRFLATILYVLLLRHAFRLVNYPTDIIGRV